MKPTDLLFQTFSSLFAGVTTDVTTLMVGMVFLMVLVLGGTKVIGIFNEYTHHSGSETKDDSDGSSFLSRRKHREDD